MDYYLKFLVDVEKLDCLLPHLHNMEIRVELEMVSLYSYVKAFIRVIGLISALCPH